MRSHVRALTIALGLFCAASSFAQTTAPVAAKASAPAAVTAPTAATPAAKPATTSPAKVAAPAAAAAAGGGDGKVWVNTKSKVYHCEGSKSYGKTKVGEYMTEADAKAKGNHGVQGKACGK
jgi:cytochrome c5